MRVANLLTRNKVEHSVQDVRGAPVDVSNLCHEDLALIWRELLLQKADRSCYGYNSAISAQLPINPQVKINMPTAPAY
jgi:hypothetical protein